MTEVLSARGAEPKREQSAFLQEALSRGRIRARQLHAMAAVAPAAAIGNGAAALVITLMFWVPAAQVVLGLWLFANAIYSGILLVERQAARSVRETVGVWPLRRIVLRATVLGILWGVLPWILLPVSTPAQMVTNGIIIAGMIACGVVRLAILPAAALSFMWTMTLLVCIDLVQDRQGVPGYTILLLIVYAGFLSRHIVSYSQNLIENWRRQFELHDSNETIGLLLNEFQDGGSDWLWQSDASGVIVNVSERFAEVAGSTAARIEGSTFETLLGPGNEGEANLAFFHHLSRREAFRDLPVTLAVAGVVRHWHMAGRPQYDGEGRFAGFRGLGADITERVDAEARIAHISQFDPLTGLMNRSRFRGELTGALGRLRSEESLAVCLLDLDKFKAVNDANGHRAGDALLVQVGERLARTVGEKGILAHMGGDEFALLQLCDKSHSEAILLAETMTGAFRQPFMLSGQEVFVTATSGVAIGRADREPDGVLREASLALHEAKAEQRTGFRFFEPGMNAIAQRRSALDQALRSAIANDELDLVYQPVVDAQSGRITCMETLLRWHSREHGAVSPTEFVPIAEESGLIVAIGEWVLGKAAREAMTWPRDIKLAVNLSPVQFRSTHLLATVEAALAGSGLEAGRLELEITESTFLAANRTTMGLLRSLQALGLRIALDDFGTGFSSLSYLKKFPFNKIKIDKSFIEGIAADSASASIVKAIIDLARALGMSTTAEGVEEGAQLLLLRALGCDTIQGYIFSPPKHARDIPDLFGAMATLLPSRAAV